MTIAARTRRLAFTVHAVDDWGALCRRAEPQRNWLATTLPISCARCLWALSEPRYALCTGPVDARVSHIRLVGAEGMTRSSRPGMRTLCNQIIGWDTAEVDARRPPVGTSVCHVCRDVLQREHRRAIGFR